MPGVAMVEAGGCPQDFPAKLTRQVVVCSIIAAVGGLMFGYDIGISGGVTSMDSFLKEFFPTVYVKKHQAKTDNYCKYNNQWLQLFTSSLYFAAIVASGFSSIVNKKFGRKPAMQIASVLFLIGAILNASAQNLAMLIIGRMFLGAGVGFGNQAVPLFISEIAPVKYRGGLNICFQLLCTLGILAANIINYFTSKHPYGWRISLGGAAVPALVLLFGSMIIVETPTSLIERGKHEKGLSTLKKIRGVDNVDKEYQEIFSSADYAKQIKHPYRNLMSKYNRPQLICGSLLQFFQQVTGITAVMFYAPVLFMTMGFGDNASLFSAVMANTVKPVCTIVAIFLVDRFGRKVLLAQAAIQMFIAQCAIGGILARHLHSTNVVPKHYCVIVILLICLFLTGFAWSWGPLCWLIPSETFPLETRSTALFVTVSINMFSTFLIAQTFLTTLCHLRYGVFFFFAVWLVIMFIFTICFLPETKGVPIDEMIDMVWKKHWFWKRFYKDYDVSKRRREHENSID
ncbi:sugar transport protein 8 [Ricinus communis]|uniref:Sugar transporter, putative n=1 Tax=Ricinus communis TaxID=3988 RepID=B9SHX9_RICCO|nr:sugar transport protein 8 [Ricinus communis]EEF36716.1 sugar transporter, putative [Ricinus communis]|eukprot:XP_002525598.1 sugar transport protein 8 [Ricinus communis]